MVFMSTALSHKSGLLLLWYTFSAGPLQRWVQEYDPTHHWWLSTLWAALPLVVLLTTIAGLKIKAHISALIALATALAIAIFIFHMPAYLAALATASGAGYGLFPIFWIIFPVIFMYQLTVRAGRFGILQQCLTDVTEDSRLQLLLIAFCLGAFFEGAAGFGTPVAVCGTILLGLGFSPLQAAGLALLANTAPVAFGGLGIPIIALHGVTGLDTMMLARVVATLLTPFCILVPFWLIWAFAGFSAMLEVWPAILVAGVSFGFTQLAVARLHGPWLVDISASVVSIATLILFLRFWKPRRILDAKRDDMTHLPRAVNAGRASIVLRASLPWIILTVFVTLWGTPSFSTWIDGLSTMRFHIPGLDQVVFRMPPAVPKPAAEAAVFVFNWLSANWYGHLPRGTGRRSRNGTSSSRYSDYLCGNHSRHALYDDHDRCPDGTWFHHALLRTRCDTRASFCAHRSSVSILWNAHRLARNRINWIRHILQRSVWKSSKIDRAATRYFTVHHGSRKLRRWSDGKDGCSAKCCCGEHRDRHLRKGGQYPAFRVPPQPRIGVPDGLTRLSLHLLSCAHALSYLLICLLDGDQILLRRLKIFYLK